MKSHALELVSPWYLWKDVQRRPDTPEENLLGRGSKPTFQKYDNGDMVNAFLKDPEGSLEWDPEDDVCSELADSDPKDKKNRILFTRMFKRLVTRKVDGAEQRKLFLPNHNRFYLVVCEIHCDIPGFPSAKREDICEAFFVIRRRQGQRGREGFRTWAWVPDLLIKRMGRWVAIPNEKEETRASHPIDATNRLYPLIPDPKVKDHAGRGRVIFFGVVPTSSDETTPKGTARFDDKSDYEIRCVVRRHRPDCPKKDPCVCCGDLFYSEPTDCYRLASHFDLVGTSQRPVNVQLPDLGQIAAQMNPTKGEHEEDLKLIAAGEKPKKPPRNFAPFGFLATPPSPDDEEGPLDQLPDMPEAPEPDPDKPPPPPPETEDIKSNLHFNTVTVEKLALKDMTLPVKMTFPKKGGAKTDSDNCFLAIPLVMIVALFLLKLIMMIVCFLFGLFFMLMLKICIPFGALPKEVDAKLKEVGDGLKDLEGRAKAIPTKIDLKARLKVRAKIGASASAEAGT